MRKSVYISMLLLAFAAFIAGCSGNKAKQDALVQQQETEEGDTTIYGTCGEGTAMHTLELVKEAGDTVMFVLESPDTCANIQGGLLVGDRLAVVSGGVVDGDNFARTVINLTTLQGKWTSLDRAFEIKEGGVVASDIKEPKPYTEWKIFNGRLVLSADTFSIYALGADSLLLENDHGIFAYKRVK